MHHSFIDKYAGIDSVLHRRDPRVKIIITLALVVSIVLTDPASVMLFAAYGMMILFLVISSRIPVGFILKRSLVVIPFVLVIAAFIPFMKKGQVVGSYSLGFLKLTVTHDGLMVLWNVLVKSYLSALCMILLTSSTRFTNLLKGMEGLKCPVVIIMLLSFMYRYVFVLEDELEKIKQAKASRTVAGSWWFHMKTVANILGSLFVRSYERGEAVYLAMCSRGFNGEIRTINPLRMTRSDLVFLLLAVITLAVVRFLHVLTRA